MSKSSDQPGIPRSMRQKRILDAAAEHPDASTQALAEKVPGMTGEVVERILKDYGDPASDGPPEAITEDDTTLPLSELPARSDLKDCQRETLRTIVTHPDATQQRLGELLDVSAPTICTRVNNLPGFEWENRYVYAKSVLGDDSVDQGPSEEMRMDKGKTKTGEITARLATLEQRIDDIEATTGAGLDLDPELTQKVLHACLHSDVITETEELEILRMFLE